MIIDLVQEWEWLHAARGFFNRFKTGVPAI
jgi:hypothetical protein